MKKISIVAFALSLLFSTHILAQEKTPGHTFNNEDFTKKLETANWLVEYDLIAWRSTDLLQKMGPEVTSKLGREWFCFEDPDGTWHAVYGKQQGDDYQVAAHFVKKPKYEIGVSKDKVDQKLLDSYGTALKVANAALISKIDLEKAPRFNQYIKRNNDTSFTVWILPAFQTNGMAVYGGEFVFDIDTAGKKVTKEHVLLQKGFRGFNVTPKREIWLKMTEYEEPPLHAVFFVMYYKNYFSQINIENKNFISTLITSDGQTLWVHIEKDKKPKVKAKP